MENSREFITEWFEQKYLTFGELCAGYGVSRKTGYKWVGRFKEHGLSGLQERRRGTGSHPWTTDDAMVQQVVALRRKRPRWGPKKLCAWLKDRGYEPPVPSTVGKILRREGLVRPQKKRRAKAGDYSSPLSEQNAPNAVWAVDFKGWFRLRNGKKCYPLTVSDGYSRYLIGCEALEHPDEAACRDAFERLFREYGLPDAIRTDNGTPFSGSSGVTRLSVWWVKLGIRPERIQRGKPSQNGRHERIHRTLKEDGASPSRWRHRKTARPGFTTGHCNWVASTILGASGAERGIPRRVQATRMAALGPLKMCRKSLQLQGSWVDDCHP